MEMTPVGRQHTSRAARVPQVMPANQQLTVTTANASAAMAVCFLREGLLDDAQQSASLALGLLKSKGRKTQPSAFWAFANAIGVILSMPAPIGGTNGVVLRRQYRRVAKQTGNASARRSSLRDGTLGGRSRRRVYHISSHGKEGSGLLGSVSASGSNFSVVDAEVAPTRARSPTCGMGGAAGAAGGVPSAAPDASSGEPERTSRERSRERRRTLRASIERRRASISSSLKTLRLKLPAPGSTKESIYPPSEP